MLIGAHVSISKGLAAAVNTAVEIGANTFQFFTRNPRGGSARRLEQGDIEEAHAMMTDHNFGPVVAHAPYTYNLASVKASVREFSLRTLREDLERISIMRVPYLVFHVGTHGGQGEEQGLELVIQGIRELIPAIREGSYLLMEGMAGEGSELGYTFTQLGQIINECGGSPRLGICLDTCHMTGAGYDLTNLEEVKEEIRRHVGLERLKVIHLNDTLFSLGARRDRHAKLGEGYLGLDTIRGIVCDSDLGRLPLILETPNDNDGYAREIAVVKKMCQKEG